MLLTENRWRTGIFAEIVAGDLRDFRIVQFSASRQFELLRGVEHDSLLFDFMVEVLSQFEVFIQPGNTFVDELRPGVKFALFVFENRSVMRA